MTTETQKQDFASRIAAIHAAKREREARDRAAKTEARLKALVARIDGMEKASKARCEYVWSADTPIEAVASSVAYDAWEWLSCEGRPAAIRSMSVARYQVCVEMADGRVALCEVNKPAFSAFGNDYLVALCADVAAAETAKIDRPRKGNYWWNNVDR